MTGDEKPIIRLCRPTEVGTIAAIINQAAQAYRNVIPPDCWHEPYLRRSELRAEIADGVSFWDYEQSNRLFGVMGLQKMRGASLIRHAYVRPNHQHRGVGSALLTALSSEVTGKLLVGTWAAAGWAIRFYERHGFRLLSEEEKDQLLRAYWTIPLRQRQTSVVLVRAEPPQGG